MANTHSLDLELSSSQYADDINASSLLNPTGNFTVEAWFKCESLTSNMVIVSNVVTTSTTYGPIYSMLANSNGSVKAQTWDSGSGFLSITSASSLISVGVWYHIAFVKSAANDWELFLAEAGGTHSSVASSASSRTISGTGKTGIRIGANEGSPGSSAPSSGYFDGLVDDVRLWNTNRTSTELNNNFETELTGGETNLQAYYKLNNSYVDETSNSFDLTASGSPVFSADVPGWSLTSAIQAYWKLDESSGNAADSVSSNTLTNNGTTTYTAAKINNGADFGTANSTKYFSSTNDVGLSGGAFSISFWMSVRTAPTSGTTYTIISWTEATAGIRVKIEYLNDAGTKKLRFNRSKPTVADQIVDYNVDLGTGTFYPIVMTYDTVNEIGYVNSVNQAQLAASGTGSGVSDGINVGRNDNGTNYSNIIIDEVGTWSRALSVSEVSDLYNSGSGLQYPFSGTAYELIMAVGTFTLTGIATLFNRAIQMISSVGTLTLTGIAVALKTGKGFTASVGQFILTGISAAFRYSGWTNDTKPSDSWSQDSKPSDSWSNESK